MAARILGLAYAAAWAAGLYVLWPSIAGWLGAVSLGALEIPAVAIYVGLALWVDGVRATVALSHPPPPHTLCGIG